MLAQSWSKSRDKTQIQYKYHAVLKSDLRTNF